MANLRIKGDVSGYVDLVAPDVAGSQTINLDKLVETDSSGNITATAFIGDGSQLTGVSSYTNSDLTTYLASNSIDVGGTISADGGTSAFKATGAVEPGLRLENTSYCTWDIFSGGGGGAAYNNWLTLYRRGGSGGGVRVEHGNLEVISGYVRAARGTVQTVINTPNTAASGNPINVWSEINSNYRVSITPQYSDTHILGTFHIPMNPTGASNILMAIQPWWSTDGGTTKNIMAQGNTSVQASRHNLSVSWFRSSNGFDANDMQNHVVHFRHDHNTTSTITFGFYFRSEGSNTTYFCHSNGNNGTWGWVAPMYFELREVTV